ncbi:LOG family protein, partial [Vibrio vulnificus]
MPRFFLGIKQRFTRLSDSITTIIFPRGSLPVNYNAKQGGHMITHISPAGSMDLLSQLEVERL